jgi:tRNA-dihydrouridine synthase
MIARAAIARPWILWQVAYRLGLTADRPPQTPEEEGEAYFQSILRLSCLLQEYFGNTPGALKRLKTHIALSHRWLLFGHEFWKHAQASEDLIEARDRIHDHAEKHPQPMARRAAT